jgi:isocitrate dehydrogenase
MVDYLGEKEISSAIFKATESVIDENLYVTYDLGGNSTLSRMAEEIADRATRILKK